MEAETESDPLDEIALKTLQKEDILNEDSYRSNRTSMRMRNFSSMYAAKKTVAQGMMDLALITANANQLRYLVEFSERTTSFYIILVLIIISLCLQVIVGIFLIFKGRFDLRHEKLEHAIRLNNCVVLGVFLISVVNVFIAAFSVNVSSSPPPSPPLMQTMTATGSAG